MKRIAAAGGLHPEQVMCLGFLLLILIGTVMLALPASSQSGISIGMSDSLFTATSAVCVTGLITVDTGDTFSAFGQIVLLALIQIGGLGFMTFAAVMMTAVGRPATLRQRLLMREAINSSTQHRLSRVIVRYALMAFLIEGAGAAALSLRMIPMYGMGRGLYLSVWHAVSAFCNAGFDVFGGSRGLSVLDSDPLALLTIAALIILGGTGFAVIREVVQKRLRWRDFSLHAKLSLLLPAMLLTGGTAFIVLLEWENPATLGGAAAPMSRILHAFFQSVTMRTAGFSSISLDGLNDGTKLLCILLMLVGANSASTGGGVKTTTVAVVVLALWAEMRGHDDVSVMGRRLPAELVKRAAAILSLTVLLFLSGTFMLVILEGGRFAVIDLMFEAASAIGTVGVTSIGTNRLTQHGRSILLLMMYLGRVGPMTMALAFMRTAEGRCAKMRYPQERVTIG